MIYQSGYLTIKDCDMEIDTFLLDFPNNEVKKGFVTLVANNYLHDPIWQTTASCTNLRKLLVGNGNDGGMENDVKEREIDFS